MKLPDARIEARKQSARGIRHVVFDERMAECCGTQEAYIVANDAEMAVRYADIEQDNILFVYRDGKEY